MRASTLLFVCACATTARANQICHSFPGPPAGPNWQLTLQVPAFAPESGTLTSVTVQISGSVGGELGLESVDPLPVTFTSVFSSDFEVRRPGSILVVGVTPAQGFTDALGAADGTIDFMGPSGVTHSPIFLTSTNQVTLVAAADLAAFTGPIGTTIPLSFSAHDSSHVSGVNINFVLSEFEAAAGTVMVCYDYASPAAPFCSGDGSGASCPCGNTSPVGADAGCLNSTGAGAALRGAGVSSLASDSLVLTCSGLPASATALFFQGDARINGGAGVVFGDGLRCAGGATLRLATKTATAGVVTYPSSGDAPISIRGSVPPNAQRFYQAWYRNSAAFCTSATFNLSEGVAVSWTP